MEGEDSCVAVFGDGVFQAADFFGGDGAFGRVGVVFKEFGDLVFAFGFLQGAGAIDERTAGG